MSRVASPTRSFKTDGDSTDLLRLMAQQLETIKDNMTIIDQENKKRSNEITEIWRHLRIPLTEDESGDNPRTHARKTRHVTPESSPDHSPTRQTTLATSPSNLFPVDKAIRIVRELKGQDDAGVEEFISSCKRARLQCSDPNFLLDMIINERIKDNAERAIRFTEIKNYDDLFNALRTNVTGSTSLELAKAKLQNTRQGNDSVQQYTSRFRSNLNELKYAIQNETRSTERRVAIRLEERNAIKSYIMGLRDEIGTQVRSLRPTDINEAQTDAMETEVWIREKNARRAVSNSFRQQPSPRLAFQPTRQTFRPRPTEPQPHPRHNRASEPVFNKIHSAPLAERVNKTCNYCGTPGHIEANCFRKSNFRSIQNLKRPPQQRTNNIIEADNLHEEEIPEWTTEAEKEFLDQLQEQQIGSLQSLPDCSIAHGNWEEPIDSEDTSSTLDQE